VGTLLGLDPADVVRRHTGVEWTVAFAGFAPGFGYLISPSWHWGVPRRSSPRTKVPAGSVALAGEFSGIYPRDTPGGWQLVGRTRVAVFDLSRDRAALLRPGNRVRFVDVGP
jgi:KipI family sensor histidine kinase inhibitor